MRIPLVVLLLTASPLAAATLFTNGSIVTNPTGGTSTIAGQPISQPQLVPNSSIPSTIPGISATDAFGIRVAEDFTVPAGQTWDLDTLTVYGWQSGSTNPPAPTVTTVKVNVWTSAPFDALSPLPRPDPLPQPVLATSLSLPVISSQFIAFRQSGTTGTSSSARPIFGYTVSLDGLPDAGEFTSGTYWLEWSMVGNVVAGNTSATQVVAAIATPRESALNGLNARQYAPANINGVLTTTWFESREIRYELQGTTNVGFFDQPMALPFELHGTATPEPTSIGAIALASALLGRRRR
jgi:hypothetical protein